MVIIFFQSLNHVDVNLMPRFLVKSGYYIVPSGFIGTALPLRPQQSPSQGQRPEHISAILAEMVCEKFSSMYERFQHFLASRVGIGSRPIFLQSFQSRESEQISYERMYHRCT